MRHWALSVGVVLVLGVAAFSGAGGCGSSGDGSGFEPIDSGGAGNDATTDATFFGGGDAQAQTLTIEPQNAVLDVTAPGQPQQFKAHVTGTTTEVQATWTVDVPSIGTIDSTGLFKASGTLGGITTVYAQSGNMKAQTPFTVRLHLTDNVGNIDPGTIGKLGTGGTADPAFKWLYPYDRTVFPRGLLPPTLQFAGAADAVYVHVTSLGLDYKGYYAGTASRVDFTPALWKTITQTVGSSDPLKIEITKISGGQVTGPAAETWTIAQGSLKGTVYYNSYSSAIAGNTGAVMRIKPGAAAPDVLIGGCTVCHAVSADGSTLVASHADYVTGASFDLKNAAQPIHQQSDASFSFGGIYPNGSILMSNASLDPENSWPPNVPGQRGPGGPRPSRLHDTKTGNVIAAPGWDGVITNAITPAFSPDGKRLGFNRYDTTKGHTLSVMDFALGTNTFTNLVDVANDPANYLAWPAFLPDSNWVIYHAGSATDFATWHGSKSDLYVAHVPSKTVAKLDALDGALNGQTYLPYGDAEAHLNYEPTMLPVAVGGYYWVVFTSRRDYGNLIVTNSQEDQPRKKLWIAAIDIDSAANPSAMARDISHPAFYLPGQEQPAGNMRGFWALDPCKQNGTTCETGDECCGGFCRQTTGADGGAILACVPPPSGCAEEFEKCTTAADCCGAASGYLCLNGHCARPAPH